MARLLVHVEGQTEETFVNEVLRPHLLAVGFEGVNARLLGNARLRARRGGIRSWDIVKSDIVRHLKSDPGAYATTIVDYYALPAGPNGWPGRQQPANLAHIAKAEAVESAIQADLMATMGAGFNPARFIPFVAMHEFEGWLFSDCASFCRVIGRLDLQPRLQAIRNGFSSPEEINDSSITAPSKRLEALLPGYQKVLHGNIAALEMGLAPIRGECPHVNSWIGQLESICS